MNPNSEVRIRISADRGCVVLDQPQRVANRRSAAFIFMIAQWRSCCGWSRTTQPRSNPIAAFALKSFFAISAMAVFLCGNSAQSEEVRRVNRLTLEQAIAMAEQNNPQIREAEAHVIAAGGRVKQSGAFPNPEAIVRAESLPLDGKGSGEYLAGISQEIPLSGSRSKAREVAKLDRDRIENELALTRSNVRKKVQSAFATALYQSKADETLRRISESARKSVAITTARVEAGDALPSDLARVEIESAQMQAELKRAKSLSEQSLAALATMVGEPALRIESLEGSLEMAFEIPALESLAQNLTRHPATTSAQKEIDLQRARLELARTERIPNINAELLYRRNQDDKRDGIDVGISFPLPIFDLKKGRIDEAKAEIDAAEFRSRSRKNELSLSLREFHAHLTTALENARLFKTEILPRAETVLQATETRYRNGDIALAEVLPIRREWATSQLAYLESYRDVLLAWANLSEFAQAK